PTIFVNKPADLEGEPGVSSKPAPASAVVLDGENASHANAAGGLPHRDCGQERGRVLIHVPRSFYYYADLRTDHREPSREDLRAMADRTEKQIRAAVGLAIHESESWKVDVDTIPDDVSLNRPAVLPTVSGQRRGLRDWGIVGAIVAAVAVLAAVASWVHMARRPARASEAPELGRRYHADSVSEPGPSERVRELIRSNP